MVTPKTQTPTHRRVRRAAKKHTKLAVVPHRANQYKPFLIRRHGLAVIMVVFLLAQLLGSVQAVRRNVLGEHNQVAVTELLSYTNAERRKQGRAALELDSKLSQAAYLKAQDMFQNQYWAHTSPQGVGPWKWVSDAQYNYQYAGENLARNFSTSQAVVGAWMQSPSHRDNMLRADYRDVGFATVEGVMNGKPVSLVVAMYGTPVGVALGNIKGPDVAGLMAHDTQLSLAARAGVSLQSMNPVVLSSVILLLVAAFVALAAQLYSRRIPQYLQNSWNKHHGLVKALGLSCLAVMVVVFYGGGQI